MSIGAESSNLQSHWNIDNIKINIVQLKIFSVIFKARVDQLWWESQQAAEVKEWKLY